MHGQRFWLLGTAAVLALGLTTPASALAGKLDQPGVAFSSGYPAEAQKKVMAVLNRKDAKFLSGHFVNSWSSLTYQGETQAANMFLEELAQCPGVTVSVSFKKLENGDWRVGHDGHANRFQVEINLASPRLDLEKLVVPAAKGPDLPPLFFQG